MGDQEHGKSRYFFKPNILSASSGSLIITDPKAELLRDCGYALKKKGYTIKVLNLDEKFNEYLKYGGLPAITLIKDNNELVLSYLNDIYNTIVKKVH